MSLGLYAAIVVKLEDQAHRDVPVSELASYTAVPEDAVRAVLLNLAAEGLCTLLLGAGGAVASACWKEAA